MISAMPKEFPATTNAWLLHDHLESTVAVYGSSENGEGQLGLAEKCFIWSINKPYSVKRRGKEIHYKLLPPFRQVMYKSLKMTWAPKAFPTSKPFYLKGQDSLWLPRNRNLNIFNDSGSPCISNRPDRGSGH